MVGRTGESTDATEGTNHDVSVVAHGGQRGCLLNGGVGRRPAATEEWAHD